MFTYACQSIRSYRRAASFSIIHLALLFSFLAAASGRDSAAEQAEFKAHMSRGIAALAERKFASAQEHFQSAQALDGNAAAAAEGLAQARLGLLLQTIASLREAAREAEKEEAWQEAADHYGAILKLNGSLSFALRGETNAAALAKLHEELDFHLQRAERLSTRAVAQEVSLLLSQAEELSPQGPLLKEKSRRLTTLLESYGKPQWVVFRSDLKTEVRVQKTGRLGVFKQRRLELFPGTYTAVGSRPGYRDVRLQFTIEPGKPPSEELEVVCKEKI